MSDRVRNSGLPPRTAPLAHDDLLTLISDARVLVIAYYSGLPEDLEAAGPAAARLSQLLEDDDGNLRPEIAGLFDE